MSSKILSSQVYRLSSKLQALFGDLIELNRSHVSYMYEVNKYDRNLTYALYENTKNTMQPIFDSLVQSYIEDGFVVEKKKLSSICLEKQFENGFIYIDISLQEYSVTGLPSKVVWNASFYTQKQKI